MVVKLFSEARSVRCRVPDELRRHSLSDGATGSYSTNLDRNRYGNDDQYLSTVIRYDLEFLVRWLQQYSSTGFQIHCEDDSTNECEMGPA